MGVVNDEPPIAGLSSAEAQRRLAASGYNELAPTRPRRIWHTVAEVLHEPMFMLLIAAGGIYLLLGEAGDALMLLVFVALIIALTVFQQHRSERVLEALRDLSSPRALVLRDGAARWAAAAHRRARGGARRSAAAHRVGPHSPVASY